MIRIKVGIFRSTPSPEGKFLEANPAMAEILGYTREELLQMKVSDLYAHPEERARVLEEVTAGKETHELEMRRRDGSIIVVHETKIPVRDERGQVLYFQGILEDITEQKQIQERYRDLTENTLVGIDIIQDDQFKYVNPRFCEMFGYSREELIGKNYLDLVAPESKEVVKQGVSQREKGERKPTQYEFRALRKDGKKIDVEVYSTPSIYQGKPAVQAMLVDITERKRMERQIELQYTYFERLFKGSPEAIALLDEDDRVIDANAAFGKLFQYEIEEIKGHRINDLIVPQDRLEEASALSQTVLRNNEVPRTETVRKRKDGGLVDVSLLGYPIRFEDKVVGVFAIYTDITERKKVEEILRRSEEKYRTLVDNLDVGITRVTPGEKGKHIEVNPAMSKILGYTREELLQKSVSEIYQDPAERKKISDKICAQGSVKNEELRLRRKDGGQIIVSLTAKAMRDEKGNVIYIDSILEDITERKQVEESLKASEEKYRTVVESSNDGIISADAQGKITFLNRAAERMFGYSRKEILGKPLTMLMPEEYRKQHEKASRRFVQKPRELRRTLQVEGLRKSGERFPVEFSFSAYKSDGALTLVAIARDLTERHQLEDQVRRAQRMEAVGEMAGGIAHDFNNVLAVIQGHAELAMAQIGEGFPIMRNLREIHQASQRAANLTRRLLIFSRREPMQMVSLDLNEVVRGAIGMLTPVIGENIVLRVELGQELWPIRGDAGNLEQVLMNLALNARDAMPEGGELAIKTENAKVDEAYCQTHAEARTGDFVRLVVKDTGVGMEREVMNRIFEPFFTTKGKQSTGLGLAVAYGIVKQHGGWIEVESSPGKGSTFQVYLPAAPTAVVAEEEAVSKPEELRGAGERILLVEDEEALRELTHRVLAQNGYEVLAVANARSARELFQREGGSFDLVLCDMVLPDIKGTKLVQEFQSSQPGLKAVFVSGYIDERADRDRVEKRGYPYLSKPFSLNKLLETLKKVLKE